MLYGRRGERRAVDRLLDGVGEGRSGVLVVRGEPGIGKSALLDYAGEAAPGFRIVRCAGVESEMEMAFAGLHQFCAALLDRLERLPAPQRNALGTAFGLESGAPPDRFFVGLAVLNLLSDTSERAPILCLVDDAQWLDSVSAQVLAFVARRLQADPVSLLFATRTASEHDAFTGLAELVLHGLPDPDARELLRSVTHGPLDAGVVNRFIAETQGNPLAILELSRPSTRARLAGGFGLPSSLPLSGRIEASYRQRIERLPEQTQLLLRLAAAEPLGDPALLWRGAAEFGLSHDAATPAELDGLLAIGARVTFRHPLVRSAAYRSASAHARREVHRVLAEVTDPAIDPDRRAWHRAQAAPGPDEEVAAELEGSAGRAQTRGGLAATAAFLQRAAELTPEPARRAGRALAAAQAAHHAGYPHAARDLLAGAQAGPLDEAGRARAALLHAQVALTIRRGGRAAALLLAAARELESLDVRLARETHLDALMAAMFAGQLAQGVTLREVAEAARDSPAAPGAPRPADLLLDGLATRITDGYAAGLPLLRGALEAFQTADLSVEELRWLWLAQITAGNLWDEQTLATGRHVQLVRDSGALATLPLALATRMGAHVLVGELDAAAVFLDEMETVSEATGIPIAPYGAMLLAAWQGRETEAFAMISAQRAELHGRGEGFGLLIAAVATALLCNSLGRYEEAIAASRSAAEQPQVMGVEPWAALAELIEAATRAGQPDRAEDALRHLTGSTRLAGTDWALGIEARCRALLAEGAGAEEAYREAIVRLGRTAIRGELARSYLLYGEWLRRENRRVDAREQLRAAHGMFTAMGMQAFAERAARELLATGEKARARTVETTRRLTPQEDRIARLAREGLSNPAIGEQLFISARTVEYHLHKVFSKLDITSRSQLTAVLEQEGSVAQLR